MRRNDGLPRRQWTSTEKSEIWQLAQSGEKQDVIAKAYHTTQSVVSYIIKRQRESSGVVATRPSRPSPPNLPKVVLSLNREERELLAQRFERQGFGPVIIRPTSLANHDLRCTCEVVFGAVDIFKLKEKLQ